MTMTYEKMQIFVNGLLPIQSSNEKPGYCLQFGGHFDGQDRLFVFSSWGRGLQSETQNRQHLETAQQILSQHFCTHIHKYRNGQHVLIVAENQIIL